MVQFWVFLGFFWYFCMTLHLFSRRIRSSWSVLAPIVNSKGFGALASLKDLIGAPKATKDDHHDYEYNDDKNQIVITDPALEDSRFLIVCNTSINSKRMNIQLFNTLFKLNTTYF